MKFVYRLAAGGACDGDCLAFSNCRQNLKTFWISLEELADIESPAMVMEGERENRLNKFYSEIRLN